MRLRTATPATLALIGSASAATENYYNAAYCESSLYCLKICQRGDFKVLLDSEGHPQFACTQGIIDYSRKACHSPSGSGQENIQFLSGACGQARGLLCVNYCVVPTQDPGRFDDYCRVTGGVPSTIMGGLTEDQAKGQEQCL